MLKLGLGKIRGDIDFGWTQKPYSVQDLEVPEGQSEAFHRLL